MKPIKPPLSFREQIDRLRDFHNLSIDDGNEAIKILKKINNYRLSGYGIGLTNEDDKDKYRDSITLKHLYSLYCFDCMLKHLIFLL